jgi:hypothetical protein
MIGSHTLIRCSIQTDPEARARVGSVIVEEIEEGARVLDLKPQLIRHAAIWLPADAVLIVDACHTEEV